jgi:hypothetical protein
MIKLKIKKIKGFRILFIDPDIDHNEALSLISQPHE